MGKSASGKDRIYRELSEDKALGLNKITMYTTRPLRSGEAEGREYHFVDDDTAKRLENENKIIEIRCYDTVFGVWKYFTADDGQIDLASGKRYIVIGTLEAYDKFCEYYGNEHIMPIYIEVDDGVRLIRAVKREMEQENPHYEELCRRFLADAKDFSEENIRKSGITRRFANNGEFDDCVDEIRQALKELVYE
jgi:guanylate kinase